MAEITNIIQDGGILCLQEILLRVGSPMSVKGFKLIRKSCEAPHTRGVAILIRSNIKFSVLDMWQMDHPSLETCGIVFKNASF